MNNTNVNNNDNNNMISTAFFIQINQISSIAIVIAEK